MREPAAREAVSGIVTLATPFVSARRRDLHRYADVLAWLMLGVPVLVPFVVLQALNLAQIAVAWLFGGVFLIAKMHPGLSKWLTDTAALEQADIVAAFQPPSIDPSKLMILCARGDEARRWLRTWDVIAQAPFAIGCVLLSVLAGATRLNLPVVVDGLTRSPLQLGLDEIRVLGFDGWALTVGGGVLCLVWGVALMCSSIMRWHGYWREPFLLHLLVEIGTDNVPRAVDDDSVPGKTPCRVSHTARTFDVRAQRALNRIARDYLRHIAICDDTTIVRAIGDWIGSSRATS